jgi:two-component sensor histidine kinase
VPLTLFLVEALTNAFRHAYPGANAGTVRVSLLPTPDGMLRLAIEDDGIGLTSAETTGGIGSRLIEAFARQVGGSAAVHHRQPSGTVVELLLPDPAPASNGPAADHYRRPGHASPQLHQAKPVG